MNPWMSPLRKNAQVLGLSEKIGNPANTGGSLVCVFQ